MKKIKKEKIFIIIAMLVFIIAIISSIAYAMLSGKLDLFGTTRTGSVKIENIDLKFQKKDGKQVDYVEPSEIDTISWKTKNIGTSAVLTRHSLEIYWSGDIPEIQEKKLFLYPSNLEDEEILADYENIYNSKYVIQTEEIQKNDNNSVQYGIKYLFIGDTLDGTAMTGKNKEVNYNLKEFPNKTDDNDSTTDSISYKLFVTPKLSYLFQGKKITIKVVTEAMQYTESGKEEWSVVNIQEL